jgi:hypothetical protein
MLRKENMFDPKAMGPGGDDNNAAEPNKDRGNQDWNKKDKQSDTNKQ